MIQHSNILWAGETLTTRLPKETEMKPESKWICHVCVNKLRLMQPWPVEEECSWTGWRHFHNFVPNNPLWIVAIDDKKWRSTQKL